MKQHHSVVVTAALLCLSACSGGGAATPPTVATSTVATSTVAESIGADSSLEAASERNTLAVSSSQTVTPIRASAFIDSVGINTHWNYPVYSRSYTYLKNLLVDAGVKHIRDGFSTNPAQTPAYISALKGLQGNGVRATLSTSMNMSVATIVQNVQALPNFVEAIEGPNEYDYSGDPLWALHLATYQQALYRGVKAQGSLAAIPVIGPAFGWADSYAKLGNLSAYMDQGNMHNYFSGFNPGTAGYGGGGFGSVYGTIAYNIGAAGQVSGTKPVVATETGYCTIPNTRNAVSPMIQAKYMPRMYLEQWLAGVPRTLQYELLDEGGSGCNGMLGIVSASLTPKPAYYALRSMMKIVSDTSSGFQTKPIALTFSAPSKNVHRLLMQKSNGTYVLALWNEVPSWDVNNGTGTIIAPVPQKIRIKLERSPLSSSLQTIVDDGSLKQNVPTWLNGVANLTIDDHLTLLTFSL